MTVTASGSPEPLPLPDPEPFGEPDHDIYRQRRGGPGGDGGGGGGESEPPDRDPPYRGYWVTLRSGPPKEVITVPSGLLWPARSVAGRVGGDFTFPVAALTIPSSSGELTDVGGGFVAYAALTAYLFDDPRLPRSGALYEFGASLADHLGIEPFRAFLLEGYPDLARWAIYVEFGRLELGSLHWLHKVGIVCGIVASVSSFAATAPTTYRNLQDIYIPAIERAGAASGEYMAKYFEKIGAVLDVDAKPLGPLPPVIIDPHDPTRPVNRRKRRRR